MTDIIRIKRAPRGKENPYFMTTRNAAQDRALSHEARGVLWYFLSKPDDWEVRETDLQQEGCRRDKTRRILRELVGAGYVVKLQEREEGKFAQVIYEVYETPLTEKPSTVNPPLTEEEKKQKKDSARARAMTFPEDIHPDNLTDTQATILARCWVDGYYKSSPHISGMEEQLAPLVAAGIIQKIRAKSHRYTITISGKNYMEIYEHCFAEAVEDIRAVENKLARNRERRQELAARKKKGKRAPPAVVYPEVEEIKRWLLFAFKHSVAPQSEEAAQTVAAKLVGLGEDLYGVQGIFNVVLFKSREEEWSKPFSVFALLKYRETEAADCAFYRRVCEYHGEQGKASGEIPIWMQDEPDRPTAPPPDLEPEPIPEEILERGRALLDAQWELFLEREGIENPTDEDAAHFYDQRLKKHQEAMND